MSIFREASLAEAITTVAFGLIFALLQSTAMATPSGCFYDGPLDGGSYDSIKHNVEHPVIDVYIDTAFLAMEKPYGIAPDVAHDAIAQWTEQVQPLLGSSFSVAYKGTTSTLTCDVYGSGGSSSFTNPTIIVVPKSSSGAGASMALYRTPNNDFHCAELRILDQPNVVGDTDRKRKVRWTLWHEFMHALGYAHSDEAQCEGVNNVTWVNDKSVAQNNWAFPGDVHAGPTYADIQNVRKTYGIREFDIQRRQTTGFASTSWSSTTTVTSEAVSPVLTRTPNKAAGQLPGRPA